jgi:hypothetical protein
MRASTSESNMLTLDAVHQQSIAQYMKLPESAQIALQLVILVPAGQQHLVVAHQRCLRTWPHQRQSAPRNTNY